MTLIRMKTTHTSAIIVCRCGDVFRAAGTPKGVARKQRDWDAEHRGCVQVQREGVKVFWLSFCDSARPKGQQFLGACVIDVSADEADAEALAVLLRFPLAQPGSEWLAAAVSKSHRLGCNPGGEVASQELPVSHPYLALYERGVLMDRVTIKQIDRRIKKAMAAGAVDPQAGSTGKPSTRDRYHD